MRSYITLAVIIVFVFIVAENGKQNIASSKLVSDASWPNCTLTLPLAETGIVGINYGKVFTANPCLAKEILNYRTPSVYVNTAYPGIAYGQKFQHSPHDCSADDTSCLAYNYGYNAGLYDIDYTLRLGIVANRWWLDVETDNSWDNNAQVNRKSLEGTFDAISRFAGSDRTGFYSSPSQWNLLTGSWRNGYPAWMATGSADETAAMKACSDKSFTGGPIVLTQFTPSLDQNYPCTGLF